MPAILIALWAQIRVKSTFSRYSKVENRRHLTGAQAAELVLRNAGIHNVRIERVGGHLSDHFDPRSNVIRLSDKVYGATTVSAVGVAAHEAGHAVQYATQYAPIKARAAMIPVANFGSQASFFLIMIGFLFYSETLFVVGIVLFSAAIVLQLITLPVEFNASSRALVALEQSNILEDDELRGARKVLRAAGITYLAALLVSVAHLLRYILMFSNRRRD